MSVPTGRCQPALSSSGGGPVVRIGAVRVRLSPVHAAQPSGGGGGSDCCCGVPWPSRSRIPLPSHTPTPAPATASFSRGIFSRGTGPATVYRAAPGVVASCLGRQTAPPDTRKLIVDEDADSGGTLDRLLKSRFGGGDRGGRGKRTTPHKKKPRTSDKTERLRELTEKLKSPPAGSGRVEPGPSSSTPAAPEPPPKPSPKPTTAPPPPTAVSDDLFECVNLKLPKPESRTIVGSYIQSKIPFRSASFSQVDYSSADGKYIRSDRGQYTGCKIPSSGVASACLTLPRKKTPDTSPSSSRATSTTVIDVTESSNASLDSPAGSSERVENIASVTNVKPPNVRALTHPLAKRGLSSEDAIPFSSIDGNGLKSLGVSVKVVPESPLEELQEESEVERTDSRPRDIDSVNNNTVENSVVSECDSVPVEEPPTSGNSETDKSRSSIQTFVTKWPEDTDPTATCEVRSIHTDFTHLKEVEVPNQKEENKDLQDTQDPPKEGDNLSFVECTTITPAMPEDKKDAEGRKRWSDDRTSGEWPSSAQEEPHSPEEGVKPTWPRRWLERPRLVCQSSEEREDEGGSPRRQPLGRTDSLSEGESDNGGRPTTPSILGESDSEGRLRSPHPARRYSKRPLRGPYGQMLEAEMKKPDANRKFSKLQYNDELKFLENIAQPPTTTSSRTVDDCHLKRSYTSPESPLVPRTSPKRKVSANIPYSAPNPITSTAEPLPVVHIRTTSSPSQLEGCAAKHVAPRPPPQPSPQLLAQLLKGSSERAFSSPVDTYNFPLHNLKDTRTHVVVELYETERSYVESLQILVMKYLEPLKSPENAGLVDAALVDEIFYQVPSILTHHVEFLDQMKTRLEHWDVKQRVGDIFLETFSKQAVIDTYTSFINNWKTAKEAIKATSQSKPAFARFLEAMAREHKGKLALDSLLIMPVQRIPRYELLIQTLLKHTETSHPDHSLLCEAQRAVHAVAVRINCTERDSLELEQLEALIEGAAPLVAPDRSLLRHDLVTMAMAPAGSGQGRKERALFLFSDLLLITSIKRRSGTIRKPSMNCPGTIASTLEANKYKLLMKISLDDLEIVKEKDESVRRLLREMENLREDVSALTQMADLVAGLHCPHSQLETDIRDMHSALTKQLAERQNSESQLSFLELTLNTQNGAENLSVIFSKPDKRSSWEEALSEAKHRLAMSADKRLCPEFVAPVPIRKTRAGLQFTCAAPTLGTPRDVWVCNSDGYVGQVCVLSLAPEPTVTSCNGVCNARILCIAAVPAYEHSHTGRGMFTVSSNISISVEDTEKANSQLESSQSSSSEDEGVSVGVGEAVAGEDCDHLQPTMWLGTEDGCIHVYNSSDNIRIKKNKIKIQHGSSVHSIIYLDNRVFVSLENGDISVYARDSNGVWDTWQPYTVSVGTVASPVTKMVPISHKLWCCCHNTVKILNISTLSVEHQFSGSGESHRSISCLAAAGLGVWLALQNSAVLRLFHASTYECLAEVNIAPFVTKMLASCDDIIRQHKAACLRVTALLACQDLLWVGTSAGVVLTLPLPHITPSTTKVSQALQVTGRSKCVPHGHTGHVRFLTAMEGQPQGQDGGRARTLVISGGDGYEDFRSASVSEVAGREDSTNHLLLWQT